MAAIPELSHHVKVLLELNELDNVISNIPDNWMFDPLREQLLSIKRSYEEVADELPEIVSEKFVEIAKDQITSLSNADSTGMMAGSIELLPDGERSVLIAETAESPEGFPYPLAFEKGRREVVPVEARVLRWWIGGGFSGTPIFSMRSSATHPRPFWANTEAAIQYVAEHIVGEELAKKGI